jgi:urease accessory protein UreF
MEPEPLAISAWLPQLLQTADPLFPTGAYAHSFGLEEMVRLGVVRDEAGLTSFMTDHLLPQLSARPNLLPSPPPSYSIKMGCFL